MMMQASFSEFEYVAKKKATRRGWLLGQFNVITPWAALVAGIEPFCPRGEGRGWPLVGVERMLHIAQQCFGLSNDGIEGTVYDSPVILRFDAESGIAHTRVATPPDTSDVFQAHVLLYGEEEVAFGDAGDLVEKRKKNLKISVKWKVAIRPGKRKALPKTVIGRLKEKIEQLKASIRAWLWRKRAIRVVDVGVPD